MKKMLGFAVLTLLWGCGAPEEQQQQQQQQQQQAAPEAEFGQRTDAVVDPNDCIIGRWSWTQSPGFIVKINQLGDGVLDFNTGNSNCPRGTLYFRNITTQSYLGSTIFYTGQVQSGICPPSGVFSNINVARSADCRSLRVDYLNGYTETYTKVP